MVDQPKHNRNKPVSQGDPRAGLMSRADKVKLDSLSTTVGPGSGDVTSNTAVSVDGEVALFSLTTGKVIKRAVGSGIASLVSGVLSLVTAPAGAIVGTTDAQTLINKTITAPLGLVKGDVGLGNVDNTSDVNKPVSTAQAAADATKQPLDSDLTTIAGLTATTDNVIQSVASAWASRTPAQLAATLPLASGATNGQMTLGDFTKLGGIAAGADVTATALAPATHAATAKATPVDADEFPLADSAASFALKRTTWLNIKAVLNTYFSSIYQPANSNLSTIGGLTPTTGNFIAAVSSAWASITPAAAKTALALVKGDVGLGNVDNTSDVNKPVSTAQAAADTAVANTAATNDATHAALTAAHGATGAVVGTTNVQTLTNKTLTAPVVNSPTGIVKADVGLGNVDNTSDVNKPVSTAQAAAIALKVTANAAIVAGTATKVSYDANGLVTAGVAATQDDIGDGTTYKQYPATDKAKLAGIAAGATVNSADATLLARANHTGTQLAATVSDFAAAADLRIPAATHAATSKTPVVDADEFSIADSAATFALKKLTWLNLKATLYTYFSSVYSQLGHQHDGTDVTTGTVGPARLGSGASITTKFLRGDSTWQALGGGSGDMLAANNLSDVVSAATARTNLGLAIGSNVQAYDADLGTIAGLTATTDNVIQAVASAWASRTPAQLSATLPAATGSVAGQMSAADFTKLAGVAAGAQVNTLTGVTAPITNTAGSVGIAAATTGAAGSMSAADKTKTDALGTTGFTTRGSNLAVAATTATLIHTITVPAGGLWLVEGWANILCGGAQMHCDVYLFALSAIASMYFPAGFAHTLITPHAVVAGGTVVNLYCYGSQAFTARDSGGAGGWTGMIGIRETRIG